MSARLARSSKDHPRCLRRSRISSATRNVNRSIAIRLTLRTGHGREQETIVSPVADPLQLMTVQEVASLLRMQKWFVYEQIKRDDLVAVKLGRAVRVRRDDLDAYMSRLPRT